MTAVIRLKSANLAKHMAGRDMTDSQLATSVGVAHLTVARVLGGMQSPGARFIAGLLAAFPCLDFADLFEVVVNEVEAIAHRRFRWP